MRLPCPFRTEPTSPPPTRLAAWGPSFRSKSLIAWQNDLDGPRGATSQTGPRAVYHAAFFKQEDGWYVVEVMDFPGVCSQGKTLRSARVMIRDALKLMAECLVEQGEPLPAPRPKAKPTMGKKPDFVETIPLGTRFYTSTVK